jgi:RHS repeat-associated protein
MRTNEFMIKRKKQKTRWRLPMRRNSFRPILAGTIYGMCSVLPLGIGTEGISQFAYELDKQGKKINAIENFWIDIDDDGTLDLLANYVNWKYDNAGRLIREVFDHYDDNFDQTSEWIYDLVGNRLKQTINGKETSYNHDANDRLLTEVSGATQTIYGYDHTQQTNRIVKENGEIISTTTYEYDLHGQLSVVTIIIDNRKEVTKYEYGADGIRTSAEHEIYVDGVLQTKTRTEYLNDHVSITGYSQVLRQTEYDSEGNIIKTISYVIGHQRISQSVEFGGETTTQYFTFDGHGSTRVLLDVVGTVLQIYSFDAYGNSLGFDTANALTEFLYSGEQFDSKIGQQYLRARYYDPTTGRFNMLDPFFGNQFDPQSFHKYLYTHADPMNNIDPSGQMYWAILAPILALGFHAWASIALDAFQFESNISFIPDAGIIGIAGSSAILGRFVGSTINLITGLVPLNPGLVIARQALTNWISNHIAAVVGTEILFNIASAQLSLVGYVGGRVDANASMLSLSCYTGLIWNLYNNSKYEKGGFFAEGSLHGHSVAVTSSSNNFANVGSSYMGITLAKSILPSSANAFNVAGGVTWAGSLFTLNFPSSFYSIILSSTWGLSSAALFSETRNQYGLSIIPLLTSFWPYAKWSSSNSLAARQAEN